MGRDKASLLFGDETLLQRTVRILSEVVSPIAVVAAPGQTLSPLADDVIVAHDTVADRGPLQGIAAGLRAVAPHAGAAYVSSCDVPLLTPAFVRHVIGQLADHEIAVPVADGFHHPLAAVYRTTVLAYVDALLAEDRLRPFFLFERADTCEVTEATLRTVDPDLASLRNLNTLADYEQAVRDIK